MHKNKRDDQALQTTNLLCRSGGYDPDDGNMRDYVDDIGDGDENGDLDDDDEAEECER